MKLRTIFVCLALFSLSLRAAPVLQAEETSLQSGEPLPSFSGLKATDDREWGSASFKDTPVLIIAFTCNRCPYAVDYEDRLKALHAHCRMSQGQVELLVINSNAGRDESLERMQERAQEKEFRFHYVKDEDQAVARALGAVYTPEFFVFDQQRRLAYRGALDDATSAEEAKTNYVQGAVSAILEGRPVDPAETGARGCTIRFKRRRR